MTTSHSKRSQHKRAGWWALYGVLAMVAVVAALTLVVFLWHYPEPPQSCKTSSDCPAHSTCITNAPSSASGVCSPPFACSSSHPCPSGQSCLAGRCQPSTCSSNADCRQGGSLRVDPIRGVPAAGSAVYCDAASRTCKLGCSTDSQCGAGACDVASHSCVRGACLSHSDCATRERCGMPPNPATASEGTIEQYQRCAAATKCAKTSADGRFGHCVQACSSTSNSCGAGQQCNATSGLCEAITCSATTDCPTGFVCGPSGVCQPNCNDVPGMCGPSSSCGANGACVTARP